MCCKILFCILWSFHNIFYIIMNKNNFKGFTLIELLVVISIIGLLSTLAVVSLNNARAKARDARRVSDIKQIQTALELYYNDKDAYPTVASATLGSGNYVTLSSGGFLSAVGANTVYMGKVPVAPTPPTGNAYTYKSAAGTTYCISFNLESSIPSLGTGLACRAEPAGATCAGNCP